MSEKNAIKEFCIKKEDIDRGVDEGKLKVQWRSCHGRSYRLLVRSEVSTFAKTCSLDPKLQEKKNSTALKEIDAELQQLELKKSSLLAKRAAILTGGNA